MTRHFCERLAAGKPAPGLFVVPQQPSAIGEVVESLLLVWTASQAEEWRVRSSICPFVERPSAALKRLAAAVRFRPWPPLFKPRCNAGPLGRSPAALGGSYKYVCCNES